MFVLIMISCFMQYSARIQKNLNVDQKMKLFFQMRLGLCHFQVKFNIFDV